MSKLLAVLLSGIAFIVFIACKNDPVATAPCNYFNTGDTGVLTAGIRMIPVQTPKGTFKVWTKRFGNNPPSKCCYCMVDQP